MIRTDLTTQIVPRNAPNVDSGLSLLVDHVQYLVDEARAAGMHGVADQLDAYRDGIAGIALDFWGKERGAR